MCVQMPVSGLQSEWLRLYESRQCVRGEQGSEKDAAAVREGRGAAARGPRGPPFCRQFD